MAKKIQGVPKSFGQEFSKKKFREKFVYILAKQISLQFDEFLTALECKNPSNIRIWRGLNLTMGAKTAL